MRRSDREISDRQAMEEIIRSAQVCRLGLVDDGCAYVVPLNFGYRSGTFYIHSARQGRKIDLLSCSQRVCIEVDCGHELVTADQPCDWGMRYASVIAFGRPRFIDDDQGKRDALAIIMDQYAPRRTFEFSDAALAVTAVIAVDVDSMTGKRKA